MKLTSIKLCNFRSFYGKTPEVTLAGGNIRNTTMIYGSNGAGKTSILNAFTWVLYEKFIHITHLLFCFTIIPCSHRT